MSSPVEHRPCQICGSGDRRMLHRQRFVPFDDGSTFDGYDVVVCTVCGHGYADSLPPQDFYDKYYREMSKYGGLTSIDASHPSYADVATALVPHFPNKAARILDIGTGAGHMLGALANRGYSQLLGIDPSPSCAREAKLRYGVDVVATPISEMAFAGQRFDLVLMTSVIEHLRDGVRSVREAAALVAPGGAIFIDAPDAQRFGEFLAAPFQQFSLEHINYFAGPSLENAFGRIGFTAAALWQDVRFDGPVAEPALSGLFRRASVRRPDVRDDVTERALRDYVARSNEADAALRRPVAALCRSGTPVIVWGVGTLTLRLLASETFAGLNVTAFVDANENYHGKSVRGIPILSPEVLHRYEDTVVISSRAHQHAISRRIREELGLANPIVTLFSESVEAAVRA